MKPIELSKNYSFNFGIKKINNGFILSDNSSFKESYFETLSEMLDYIKDKYQDLEK